MTVQIGAIPIPTTPRSPGTPLGNVRVVWHRGHHVWCRRLRSVCSSWDCGGYLGTYYNWRCSE